MSNLVIEQIKRLFIEKKYEEVIKTSENFFQKDQIPTFILNLLGVSNLLKKIKDEKSVLVALSYFEKSHLQAKNKIEGLDGLINLIRTSIMHLNNPRLHDEIIFFLSKAKKFYLKSEKYYDKNENFLIFGSDLFKYLLDHEKQKEILQRLINLNTNSKVIRSRYLFDKNYNYEWSQKNHHQKAVENSKFLPKFEARKIIHESNKNNKIKIGVVSSDLRSFHPLTFFIKPTFENFDKNSFECHAFSFARRDIKDVSQNDLIKCFDRWHDLHLYENQKAINYIQDQKIDILIDIMGFTSAKRIEIFNTRVCKTQISWLAYCNTLGFDTVDYLFADHNVIYKDEEQYYSEKIVRLPEIWNSHSGFKIERNFNSSPINENKFITFGSFGNFRKISDDTIEVWSSILKNIQGSKLILKSSINFHTEHLIRKFEKYGVRDKIKIYKRFDFKDIKSHLNLYKEIDIGLDTFPYNGVTTTFEALWMGVPVITMKGYNFNSRCGESIIKNSGFNSLICADKKDYVERAIHFSKNINELNELRLNIYKKILDTPLFNNKKFSVQFFDTLKQIARNDFKDN